MHAFLDRIERAMAACAGVVTLLLMAATALDAASRYLLHRPITGMVEVTGDYAIVAIVFLSLSHASRQGSLIRIPMFVQWLPASVERWVNHAVQLLSVAVALLLAGAMVGQLQDSIAMRTMSVGAVEYVLWPSYVVALAGLSALALRLLIDLPRVGSKTTGIFADSPDL
ncbi:TRAP transporter small permease subunit [Azospirillum sp. RWY-5-1]|uniref:TRAP transporter small permease protein n=1 Tax=Azospirillum oleiclasticum TaxID=2735135 RepID=A0ABX2TGR8_9PROT|nr:TRAP transporter small permease subunit [Azospirillum oleiclasticum]NYZ14401.1 TRAP transporter small permease subunit [Azospirillum oleiclasticum]NYZ23247.1 TRAP transporter small permease subunit [Azospirillum oleiclasticum]